MDVLLEKIEREEEFLGIQRSVGEKLNEISLKERNYGDLYKEVNLIQDRMEIWAKELGLKEEQNIAMRKLNEERSEELRVVAREHDLKLEKIEGRKKFVEEKLKEIGLNERKCESLFKEINLIQKSMGEEFSLREEKVRTMQKINDERSKELGIIAQEFDLKLEKIVDREKFMEEKLKEIGLKERNCESFFKEINLIQKSKEEEFSLREEKVRTMQKINEERSKELGIIAQEYDLKLEKIVDREKVMEEKLKEIGLKERNCESLFKEINLIQKSKEEEFSLREEKLSTMQKRNEKRSKELEMEKEGFQNIKNICDEKWNEIFLKERNCENRCKELDLREEKLKEKQKLNEESFEKITMEKKSIKVLFKNVEKEKEEVEVSRRSIEEKLNEISLIKNNFGDCSTGLDNHCKELDVVEKECKLKKDFKKSITKNLNEINLRKNDCCDLNKEVDLILDPIEKQLDIISPEFVTMDGRALQIYINEHYKDHNLSNKVCKILQSSTDPVKLVLDAMEGFYPPHLKKGDVEFRKFIVRKSCVFLLEKLMKLSPFVTPHVREAALRLALEWKVKMEAELCSKNYLEILAFLGLLVSYKLASYFIADEILNFLELVATHSGVPQICLALGIPEKVPDLIKRLIRNNQHFIAVRFIVTYGLVKEFCPELLLKDYLRISEKETTARLIETKTREAQEMAIDEMIACLRNIMICICSHKLKCRCWFIKLKKRLKQLEEQKCQKPALQTFKITNPAQIFIKNKFVSPTNISVTPKSTPDPTTKPFSCLLANMDAKRLFIFLHKNIKEHQSMCKELFFALQFSIAPAELVLDIIFGSVTPHLITETVDIEENAVRTCIFLLEIFTTISPDIKPKVKEAARGLAVDWKENILKHTTNQLLTLEFLIFVHIYGITTEFNSDELRKIYQTIADFKLSPGLIHILGFSEEIPVVENLHQSVQENPTHFRLLDDDFPDIIRYASDPAQLVLDAVESCYYSILGGGH